MAVGGRYLVSPLNSGIELHDSHLAAISFADGVAVVSLSPVYVHRSVGRPGVDSGSGWLQSATLTLGNASLVSRPVLLPATISEGSLRIGSEAHANLIPAAGIFTGAIELSLVLSHGGPVTIHGQRICIQLHGEPSFVENFDH